jgi:hypothetical protein
MQVPTGAAVGGTSGTRSRWSDRNDPRRGNGKGQQAPPGHCPYPGDDGRVFAASAARAMADRGRPYPSRSRPRTTQRCRNSKRIGRGACAQSRKVHRHRSGKDVRRSHQRQRTRSLIPAARTTAEVIAASRVCGIGSWDNGPTHFCSANASRSGAWPPMILIRHDFGRAVRNGRNLDFSP